MSASDSSRDADHRPNQLVDWNVALQSMGGDERLLRTVTDTLIVEAPSRFAAIERAIAANDPKRLRLESHTLKSALRYFGVEALADFVKHIEDQGAVGNVQVAAEDLEPLRRGIDALVIELRERQQQATPNAD